MRKAFFLIPFLLAALHPAFASVCRSDAIVASAAVTDATTAVAAGFVATPRYEMPGCFLRLEEGKTLPSLLTFRESDIGLFLASMGEEREEEHWYSRALSAVTNPLDPLVRTLLTVHDWKSGEAVMNGTVIPFYGDDLTLPVLFARALKKEDVSVPIAVDVNVRGVRLTKGVHISGLFTIVSRGGELSIDPVDVEMENL